MDKLRHNQVCAGSIVYLRMTKQIIEIEKVVISPPSVTEEIALPVQDRLTEVPPTAQEHLENKVDAINLKKSTTPR